MATTKTAAIETPAKLLIQIDDEIREMTDDEFAIYEQQIANIPELPKAE